ncbi:MAG: aldo/keto reductase [Thalassobaculum sp.]
MPGISERDYPAILRRPLYRGGPEVGVVGFGTWGVGGATPGNTSYGATDDSISISALQRAHELGISFFDTSPAYGDGHSERLIGRALGAKRAGSVISSKVGIASWRDAQDFSAAAIRASLRGTLERLGTDHLDVLFLHSPSAKALAESGPTFDTLDSLVTDGVIGTWGISCKAPADALEFLRHRRVDLFQVNLNMLDQRAVQTGLLDLAFREGIGIVARTPLCFGFLTGLVNEDTDFVEGDHRRGWSRTQRAKWADGARKMMAAVGAAPGDEATVAALRFCLSFPAVSCVLPGALTAREVEAHALAGRLGALPEETRGTIMRIYACNEFFVRG